MERSMKIIFWIYIGILFTVVEVMAFLFWRMLLSNDHTLLIGEPNDWLFYTELVVLTFAASFTFIFSYLVTLGRYRIEIVDHDGLTRDEARKAKENRHDIQKLKEKINPLDPSRSL